MQFVYEFFFLLKCLRKMSFLLNLCIIVIGNWLIGSLRKPVNNFVPGLLATKKNYLKKGTFLTAAMGCDKILRHRARL